ncbi:prepilin-type N-terminal cleavage/methylation domain-containing protein [candidate division KSB1 bacterium]|nr:prepilin-type N-terminal cleavage/methylation domain-containing protein [candidate division KSB1 bacterium]
MIVKNSERQQGFTLVEVLVVVVIVAILAAISVPIYLDYVEGARAADAQSTMGAIFNGVKMYRQQYGRAPADVEELEEFGILTIDDATQRKWIFQLNAIADDLRTGSIQATSTDEMRGGAGQQVRYDLSEGRFYGYGLPPEGAER